MAAIFDAIRSMCCVSSPEPGVSKGYQPSEFPALRSSPGLNDYDKLGPSNSYSNPVSSFQSYPKKDDDRVWPGESRGRPPSPPPAALGLQSMGIGGNAGNACDAPHSSFLMKDEDGLWAGENYARPTSPSLAALESMGLGNGARNPCDAPFSSYPMKDEDGFWPGESGARPQSPPPPARSFQSMGLGSNAENPCEPSKLSFRSSTGDSLARRGSMADRQLLNSFGSLDVPDNRQPADMQLPKSRSQHASFASQAVDSPSRKEWLVAQNRIDSFASERSHAPSSASGARRYSGPPPMPYSNSVRNNFMDHEELLQQRRSSAPYYKHDSCNEGLRLGVTSAPFKVSAECSERPCDKWTEGSILDVFSASASRWYVAQVSSVQPQGSGEDVLTVAFYISDEMKQKSVHRTDPALAPLSTYTFSDLPPGFEPRPSQSRPGQLVYLDATTGTKYASLELAWRLHFERLQRQPNGCETVACMPSRGGLQVAQQLEAIAGVPSPMNSLYMSEHGQHRAAVERPLVQQSPLVGKVELPSFGDKMGSQGAYLGYVRTPGAATTVDVRADVHADALANHYQVVNASAPMRPIRVKDINPARQNWQEDAFSEWRR